jgi:hypothetical protein
MGKIVNSHHVEYGYELLSVLPYAYHLHLKGQLDGTISSYDTKPLYFFSPNHTEVNERRAFLNIHKAKHDGIPNTIIHRAELDWNLMTFPPLKDHYKDTAIKFDKPTVCVCNRYTKEWNGDPINFLNLDILGNIFESLKEKYQIVYVSISGKAEYYDNNEEICLDDKSFIEGNYDADEVSHIDRIMAENNTSFNETVLRVFAGCEKFITMNGGYSILASYFGGENIIYSKYTQELREDVNSFHRWYYRMGGSTISHVDSYDNLTYLINRRWVDEIKHKSYFLINTFNPVKTRKKIKEILSVDPYSTVVVYAAKGCIDSVLSRYRVIILPAYTRKKTELLLSDADIKQFCKTGNYDIIDISKDTTLRSIGAIKHLIQVKKTKKQIEEDEYGYSDIIPQ